MDVGDANVPDCHSYLCLNDQVPCCSDFQVLAHLKHPQTFGEVFQASVSDVLGGGLLLFILTLLVTTHSLSAHRYALHTPCLLSPH